MIHLGNIFAYIKKHPRSIILFDPKNTDLSDKGFVEVDWVELYYDEVYFIPPKAPESWGRAMRMSMLVNSIHAENIVTYRLNFGLVVFIGRLKIIFY